MENFTVQFTEEQIAIILQALNHYMYNNPYLTEEQWEIANKTIDTIDQSL